MAEISSTALILNSVIEAAGANTRNNNFMHSTNENGCQNPSTTGGSGTVSPSNYSNSSAELPTSLIGRNEMVTAENSGLRDRVAELERKVQEQEDELVCLRSSMADVLRRLNQLESGGSQRGQKHTPPMSQSIIHSNGGSPGYPSNMANRALSRSTGNLRKNLATSNTSLANSEIVTPTRRNVPQDRRTVSPSPKRTYSVNLHNGPLSPSPNTRPISPKRTTRNSVSGSMGLHSTNPNDSGGLNKKWVSSHDMVDHAVSQSPIAGGRAGNTNFHREPIFVPDEKILQVFIRGKPVTLLTPSSVDADYSVYNANPAPPEKLKLEWIYGYRGRDCRSNLHLLPTGEIVYFTATVAVLYNHEEKAQRHYLGHTDDIKCIAIHPNRLIIASGQTAKGGGMKNRRLSSPTEMDALLEEGENSPHVRIWDSISLQTQHVLGIGEFERAVSCVAFSKADGGGLLAVVDESYEHTLSVWDWQRRRKITETKSANEQVFSCEFHPTEKHLLVTCGKSQISFWIFDGVTLQKKQGIFEGRDKPKYVLCLSFSNTGEILSGDSNGTISVWDWRIARVTKQATKAHSGGVFAICPLKGGLLLSGGGRDRRLIEWTDDLKPTGRISEVPDSAGPVRTISQGKGNLLLIGTTHNSILQGSIDLGFAHLVQGHLDELWGVTSHPTQQQFLTCGYDKTLRLWDGISHSMVWLKEIADPAHCACFHPSGSVFVIGTSIGRWLVLDSLTRDVIIGQKDGNDIISRVAFSPNGSMLGVGSQDGNVYMYAVSEDGKRYNRIGKCGTHNSFVTAFDWSTDGQFLRTNTGEHEVLFWYAVQCKPITSAASVRDVNWATDSCTMSFGVFGVWPDGADGSEVNGCARSKDRKILAAADDAGTVRLLKYPASQPKSNFHSYSGHSSHVTGVDFLANDNKLISIGGKDSAVFQWNVNKINY